MAKAYKKTGKYKLVKKKGKAYKVYKGTTIPSKSAMEKQALKIAAKDPYHAELIDFISARYTLQLHGWFDPGEYKNITEISVLIKKYLKQGKDPLKELKGKYHYDLRILPKGSKIWFGLTFFRAPWTGTAENKVQGLVKGYQQIHPKAKKLREFLRKDFESTQAERIWEKRDVLYWMKVRKLWAKPGEHGNPMKNQNAIMIAIPGDYFTPCVLHRRELDFYDLTFLGEHLKGRFYYRLVERKLKESEMTKAQRKKGAATGLFFYFWKAKKAFNIKEMRSIATSKKKKEPLLLKEAAKIATTQS